MLPLTDPPLPWRGHEVHLPLHTNKYILECLRKGLDRLSRGALPAADVFEGRDEAYGSR